MSQIGSVQALRAGAALAVTFGHLEHEAASLPSAAASGFAPILLDLTGAGVDLFFIISGFVMVHASRDLFGRPGAAPLFLVRRLARIVPLYWLMTTMFLLTMLAAHVLSSAAPTAAEVVESYLFIPYLPHEGGPIQPVFKLGWTLNYEMFFYLVFSAALMLPARAAVAALACFFVGLVALGLVAEPEPGPLGFWTHPIILEFVFGAILALAFRGGLRFGRGACLLLVLAGSAGFAAAAWSELDAHGALRPLVWGVPAALIFAGCVLRAAPAAAGAGGRVLVAFGDASYAIYLLHPLVVRGLRVGVDKAHAGAAVSPWLFVAFGVAVVVPLACAVHRFVERPLTRGLSRRLGTSPTRRAPAGSLPV